MKKRKSKSAFTLVEIMLSLIILTILALTGGAVSTHLGVNVAVQNNKRIAVNQANRRLEQLVNIPYGSLRPGVSSEVYVDANNELKATKPNETIAVNGVARPIVTTVQRINAASPAREYLLVSTSIEYDADGNTVLLKTFLK